MKRLLLLVPLAACGGEDEPPLIDQLACNHLHQGPFQTITLGDTRDSSAPALEPGEITYRIEDGSAGGFAAFGADGTAYGIYLTTDVAIEITDAAGEVVVPDEDDPGSAACPEIGHRLMLSTEAGVYYLDLSAGATNVYVSPEPFLPD